MGISMLLNMGLAMLLNMGLAETYLSYLMAAAAAPIHVCIAEKMVGRYEVDGGMNEVIMGKMVILYWGVSRL